VDWRNASARCAGSMTERPAFGLAAVKNWSDSETASASAIVGADDKSPLNSASNGSLELGGQLLGFARQDRCVHSHGSEGCAPFDVAARGRVVHGEDAGALAARADARDGVLDRRLDFGMRDVAEVAEPCREVRGTDEHAVDSVHARDRLEIV